jgi:transcriptional activator SPT7
MPQPPPFEPVTIHNVSNQIGLVQEWFLAKLRDNNEQPLVEDEDLPSKQRFPKPRLPATGKITSPRKRPLKEQNQMKNKKRKIDEGKDSSQGNDAGSAANGAISRNVAKPVGKLRLDMPSSKENQNVPEPEKEDGSAVGMISPESILAA